MTGLLGGCAAATLLGMLLFLYGERSGSRAMAIVGKMGASTAFVVAGWSAGPTATTYGILVLAGLHLGWLGDLFLLSSARGPFLAGLVSFLLGHVAYAVAFAARGVEGRAALAGALPLVASALVVDRWLGPRVGRMKGWVRAYILTISAMVALAAGSVALRMSPPLILGAILFYLSDLAVARDRFVAPGLANKLWGGPAYFGGQLLLAASIASSGS